MCYEEKCPICNSEDYEVEDYSDTFDTFSGEQWWICVCPNGHKFSITKIYDLKDVIIEPEE